MQAVLWLCLSLSYVSLFEEHTHTKDGSQAASVRLNGSPVRHEHMEQSSSFQMLVWSFSPSPTEVLCVMRGCIRGPALHSQKPLFVLSQLSMRTCFCLFACLSVCLRLSCLCTVQWAFTCKQSGRQVRGTAVGTDGESDGDSHHHLSAGVYTQLSGAKMNMHMHAIMHTHKGLRHVHRLHHTPQVISSLVRHLSSKALQPKQTVIPNPLIYSERMRQEQTVVQAVYF